MSISLRWVERPAGIVGRAYERSTEILRDWSRRSGNEDAAARLGGWPGVDLCEHIARELLLAQGYDEELLDEAIDGGPFRDGMTAADLDAELERTRTR